MDKVEKIYNLKIIKSGAKLEIYKFNNYVLREGYSKEKEPLEGQLEFNFREVPIEEKKSNRVKSLRRSQNNIIRLIQSNPDMTTFITLTFAEEQNYKYSKKYLNNFFNKLRKDYPNLKYLWVLEYGEENGRLHYHVLTNILSHLNLKVEGRKSNEHKSLEKTFMDHYWKYGFVDIRDFKQEENINIALYVSTYMIKSLKDINLEGYRIYGYSHKTLEKPLEIRCYSKDSLIELLNTFDDYRIKYQSSYKVGFTDWRGERKGSVTYLDMYKGDNEYENK